jgi:sialate O-acetylesterase
MKPHPLTLLFSLLLASGLPTSTALADVTLPAIFSDHMVLQADAAAPVWGQAEPGEVVTVTIGSQTKSTEADSDGNWSVKIDPMKPGQVGSLTVKGKNTIAVTDVLAGEVWLCSGQSNMAFGVGGQERTPADLPEFRIFTETSQGNEEPGKIGAGKWQICSPEIIKDISGTAYFFGRNLHESLGRPVGVVVSAVPGSAIESWTDGELQKDLPDMELIFHKIEKDSARGYNPEAAKANYEKAMAVHNVLAAEAQAAGRPSVGPPRLQLHPRATGPGGLFNGKIAPLIPYAIRGAIWYQGETNAQTPETGKLYATKFSMMINDWRARWGQGDFPFVWVQLPKYTNKEFQGWRELRESQLETLRLPNTGMIVTADMQIPDPTKIHPDNKRELGLRLCAWTMAKVYGKNTPFSGPLPTGQEIKGSEIVCSFEHAGGMKPADGELKGFMIAGSDKKWVPATAKVEGEKVVVSSPDVSSPVAVRYSWEDVPDGNLVNADGLPASPFRSDDW